MAGLNYRPEIDGLRAVSVLAVVAYHVGAGLLPGGFVGVDVFFVISGYLITTILCEEWRTTGRIDLASFYARRIIRLMPVLWLVVAMVLAVTAVWLGPAGVMVYPITDSALAALAFVANFYFQNSTGGYFDGPSEQLPLLHLWSLAVEEQFYLVYPALLMGLLWRAPGRLRLALVTASIVSIALAEHWLQVAPAMAFHQMPARFWELACGALVATAAVGQAGHRLPAWVAAAGLGLVCLAMAVPPAPGQFPGLGALPAVLGASMVVWAVHVSNRTGPVGALLGSKPLVAIGLISYPLYLWHWPLLAIDHAMTRDGSPLAFRLGLAALAVVLAWCSHRWVEKPLRFARRLPVRTVFAVAAIATMTLAAAAMGLARTALLPADVQALVERTANDRPAHMDRCHFGLGATVDRLRGIECRSAAGLDARVAIWGDSHALAWQPFAAKLALARGVAAVSFTMDSCPPLQGYLPRRPDFPRHHDNCAALNALAAERIRDGDFQTVVLAARWTSVIPVEQARPGRDDPTVAIQAALSATLASLSNVPEVLVIGPTPQLPFPAGQCIAAGRLVDCVTPRKEFEQSSARVRRVLSGVVARFPNARLVDPTNHFCGPDTCAAMKDGRALYWDDNHVAASAAEAFAAAYLAEPARYTSRDGVEP